MDPVVKLDLSGSLTINDIEAVAYGRAKDALDGASRQHLADFRARAEADLKSALERDKDKRVYGLNTGFGSNFKDNHVQHSEEGFHDPKSAGSTPLETGAKVPSNTAERPRLPQETRPF